MVMVDNDPKDFYYIDEQLLRMYYTQLPEATQAKFRSRALTNTPMFTLSLSPKFDFGRYRPELPFELRVALALFMEAEIRKLYEVSALESITSKFIVGTFRPLHGVVALPKMLPILVAYPEDGIGAELSRHHRSFVVLGEAAFCWRAWQFKPEHSVADFVFSRLLDIFQNYRTEKANDVTDTGEDILYDLRPGGQDDYLDKLMSILDEYRKHLKCNTFRGMFIRRQVLHNKLGVVAVLYPLFLRPHKEDYHFIPRTVNLGESDQGDNNP